MINGTMLDDELKQLILSDETLINKIIISIFFNAIRLENPEKHRDFDLSDYDFYNWYFNEKQEPHAIEIKEALLNVVKNGLSDTMINDTYNLFNELKVNEGKQVLYTLSRLFYLQDKYKNNIVGQTLDKEIKNIKHYIEDNERTNNAFLSTKECNEDNLKEIQDRILAYETNLLIPSINYDVYLEGKPHKPFLELWLNNIPKQDIKDFLINSTSNNLKDAQKYNEYSVKINSFINDTISNKQFNDFLEVNKIKLDDIARTKSLLSVKGKYIKNGGNDKSLEEILNEPQLNKYYELFSKYQKQQAYLDLKQIETDIKTWRDKTDKFIARLKETEHAEYNTFNLMFTLMKLTHNPQEQFTAYNPRVIETRAINTPDKPTKKITTKALKEKYKNEVLIKDKLNDTDFNIKWAKIDTSKINTNVLNLRENIINKVSTNKDITLKRIKEIEAIKKPTKKDLEELAELKETYNEQLQNIEHLKAEIVDKKDDILLITQQIEQTTNATDIKKLTTKKREMEKDLKDKEHLLNENGVYLQMTTEGKILVAEKENKRKKEHYKLMVNADYDIQKFNNEGRNFLHYIPNIDGIINQLDEEFITIDLSDYLEFTGRPTGNTTRIRRNLLNTLIEMRKESYEYSFIDPKGALQEGSLVLIGDVKTTEFKGKATIKVQLGATFKENIKNAFMTNQIASVKKDTFRLGQGKNNKVELMARELYVYFVRLARTEAKKGLTNGQWRKLLHLEPIITYLAEINLIKYDPNDYNHNVKEPLENALNMGMELGLFKYETNAFKYYDDIISTANNGANIKDKVLNFETHKDNGIYIYLNANQTDLEKNNKAFKTYTQNKKRYDKATKK